MSHQDEEVVVDQAHQHGRSRRPTAFIFNPSRRSVQKMGAPPLCPCCGALQPPESECLTMSANNEVMGCAEVYGREVEP